MIRARAYMTILLAAGAAAACHRTPVPKTSNGVPLLAGAVQESLSSGCYGVTTLKTKALCPKGSFWLLATGFLLKQRARPHQWQTSNHKGHKVVTKSHKVTLFSLCPLWLEFFVFW